MGACGKLRYDFPEVSIVRLLDVWFRGTTYFEVAVYFALGRGLLAQLLYMLELCWWKGNLLTVGHVLSW